MAGKRHVRWLAALREILGRWVRPPDTRTWECTVSFADASTGIAHRISAAEAFATDHRAGERYTALCGARVRPARLTTPARYHCPICEQNI